PVDTGHCQRGTPSTTTDMVCDDLSTVTTMAAFADGTKERRTQAINRATRDKVMAAISCAMRRNSMKVEHPLWFLRPCEFVRALIIAKRPRTVTASSCATAAPHGRGM